MNILKAGLEWLHARREESMTSAVTYRRGGLLGTLPMFATIGRMGGDTLLETELEINSLAWDFIIDRTYFVDVGQFWEPQPGDEITIDETGAKYEVSSEGADRVWRFSGPHEIALRIHTHQTVR